MRPIKARTMLIPSKDPDNWFGVRYVFNIYRGCEHSCIYCDSRSECYGIDDFGDVQVKENAPALLWDELARKRKKATVGTGSMSDPYGPVECQTGLTRSCLLILDEQGFGVHISTKGDLVCRDKDILQSINRTRGASVAFTVTTCDDDLAAKIEPAAPSSSRRLAAMRELSDAGIHTGVLLMPVLPYVDRRDCEPGRRGPAGCGERRGVPRPGTRGHLAGSPA